MKTFIYFFITIVIYVLLDEFCGLGGFIGGGMSGGIVALIAVLVDKLFSKKKSKKVDAETHSKDEIEPMIKQ